jgi:hypothetical protein
MSRLRRIVYKYLKALLMFTCLLGLSLSVWADQALLLGGSSCNQGPSAAIVNAHWGPNGNGCRFPTSGDDGYSGSGYQCSGQNCIINGPVGQNCTTKVCAASVVNMNNACTGAPTTEMWIITTYTGGGPHCGSHPC